MDRGLGGGRSEPEPEQGDTGVPDILSRDDLREAVRANGVIGDKGALGMGRGEVGGGIASRSTTMGCERNLASWLAVVRILVVLVWPRELCTVGVAVTIVGIESGKRKGGLIF
jgi:hypothetical protein